MSVVVGQPPAGEPGPALGTAAALAAGVGEPLVVTTVLAEPWDYPSKARVGAEYQAWLREEGERALARAREALGDPAGAAYELRRARSVPAGLVEVAAGHRASAVVLGAAAGGPGGGPGSTAARLLHSAPAPVLLVPAAYGPSRETARVSCAYAGTPESEAALRTAHGLAGRFGVALRVLTVAVGLPRSAPAAGVGLHVEDDVRDEWVAEVAARRDAVLGSLAAGGGPSVTVTAQVVEGDAWATALDATGWAPGEFVVVGSSSAGPLARVFLGSRATKIVRHSPVPVLVVPRG